MRDRQQQEEEDKAARETKESQPERQGESGAAQGNVGWMGEGWTGRRVSAGRVGQVAEKGDE